LLFAALTSLFGQNNNLSIGFVSSLEMNKYNYANSSLTDYEYDPHLAYSAGLGLQYKFNKKFVLKSGLTYYSQGYQVTFNYNLTSGIDKPVQSELSISYLRIPFSIGLQLIEIGLVKFKPSLGATAGFQINTDEHTLFSDNSEKPTTFVGNSLNTTLISILLDLEFELRISRASKLSVVPFFSKAITKTHPLAMRSGQQIYGVTIGLYFDI